MKKYFAAGSILVSLLFLNNCNNTIKIGFQEKKTTKQEKNIPARCKGAKDKSGSETPDLSVTFLVDKTSSGSEDALQQNSWKFTEAITNSRSTKIVDVTNFGSNGQSVWADPAIRFNLPEKISESKFDETILREQVKSECGSRKRCIDKKVAEMQNDLKNEFSDLQNQCIGGINEVVSEIAKQILLPPKVTTPCTSIYHVLERALATESDRIIIVTDGNQTCPKLTNNLNIQKNQKILILISPLKNEAVNEDFLRRINFVKSLIPDAEVFPLMTVSSDTISKFLE